MRRALFLLVVLTALATAQDRSLKRLEREIARVSAIAGGTVGASILHLETGRRVTLNGLERFPMASSYKIPIAIEVLQKVDDGELRLDQMVTLEAYDLHPGSGTISALFNKPGVALSIRNLMELMLLISDNAATDVLMRLAGGPEAVMARLKALGISGIDVSRPTVRLIADWAGIKQLPPERELTQQRFNQLEAAVPPQERRDAARRFDRDPRDTATPDGMTALLARVWRRDLLKPASANLLLDILRRCQTGNARLKGVLPDGTEVAHKTGSLGGSTNDVGIMTLPQEAGHMAISVFVKASDKPVALRERAIAEIARAAHDYFLFNPETPMVRNYDKMAARIVAALKPARGERVLFGGDPAYFQELVEPLRRRLREAGAVETSSLDSADIYLWLPLGAREISAEERAALAAWLDAGGSHREIHFHWSEGSVEPDGLRGAHSPELDRLYESALDIDYAALSEAQDRAIAVLRSGVTRVRTPAGTDLNFRVGDRPFNKQDGDASAERMKQARVRVDREIELPAGVLRVAPIEESVNGRIVIPAARFPTGVARNIRMDIKSGEVVNVEADENLEAVEAALTAGGESARRFREFALGFHPRLATPPGSPSLPYYGYGAGVVRLSLGDNNELGGNVRGGFTRWFFFPDATVDVDGKALIAGK